VIAPVAATAVLIAEITRVSAVKFASGRARLIERQLGRIRSLEGRRCAIKRGFIDVGEYEMAKKAKSARREYTKEDVKQLKTHSKARTPVAKLSKLMKRSQGSLRQKARVLGIGLGHQR
jgi:hypothetical protein